MNWKFIFLILNFSFINSQNDYSKQLCMMNFVGDNKCNNVESSDSNFKCCQIDARINSYSISFCSYLQWKLKDALDDEKDRLKTFYNAKSIKIKCNGNYLNLSIFIILLDFILF
jgi:hypothetical protein